MKNWSKLWDAEVSDEPIPIIPSTQKEQESKLDQSRSNAKESFRQNHGQYAKISVVKNKEHHLLLNKELVPQFEDYLNKIVFFEEQLSQASEFLRILRENPYIGKIKSFKIYKQEKMEKLLIRDGESEKILLKEKETGLFDYLR